MGIPDQGEEGLLRPAKDRGGGRALEMQTNWFGFLRGEVRGVEIKLENGDPKQGADST